MKLCLRCNQYFEDNIEQCPSDQTWLESVGKDPLIGALINNRYLVDSVIGKGSSGIVYRATRLGRGEMVVAIKVLHSFIGAAGSALDRFMREAQAASRLRNPHIITIWESGVTEDGQPYFVMDYLDGITLGHLIREKGQLEPQRVISIIRQTCEALIEAHRLGITHRDLKPENIVLQETGNGDHYIKLLDFGIADSPQHAMLVYNMEKPRTVSGSPAYMSPEQCQGFELDGRSDIYSLAIVVFEMLTGTRPFRQSEDVNVMVLHVSQPPMTLAEARPDLIFPTAVENVLACSLSKLPAQRQATIQDFLADLEQAWQSFDSQPTVNNKNFENSIITLNKLQQVAQTTAAAPSTPSLGTVDTELARVKANLANQPSILGTPPARMSRTHNNLQVSNQLSIDHSSKTSEQQTVNGTSTVQRLMAAAKRGTTQSQLKIVALKNQSVAAPEQNAIIDPALDSKPLPPQIKSKQPETPTHYVKQQHRNTISRLEGWKNQGRERPSIVSTRVKAAALKGERVRRPVNIWHILLGVTTMLCLGSSGYVIYSALSTQIPRPQSVHYLTSLGKYEQVKTILEQKRLTGPLNPLERDQLSLAYFNLAKSSVAKHRTGRALILLSQIDPQSSSARQGQRLRDQLIKLTRVGIQAK